jgi:hypothetical protein
MCGTSFPMIVLCCDTIVLCFTKLQGAVHIIEITQHSSRPPPLRDNSFHCCWRFVSSLTRAVVLLHHMTVSGAVSLLLYSSCLVHGFANYLVTPPQREIAPFPCATFARQNVTAADDFLKLHRPIPKRLTHSNFG